MLEAELTRFQAQVAAEFKKVHQKIGAVQDRVKALETSVKALEESVDEVKVGFDNLAETFEKGFGGMAAVLSGEMASLAQRVETIEEKLKKAGM